MYYIRKFDIALWHDYDYITTKKISSRAVTTTFKSTNSTVSLWKINDLDLAEEEGILALLGSMSGTDTIEILIFTEKELLDIGLTLTSDDGNTKFKKLTSLHTNIIELDLDLLSGLANLFAKKFSTEEKKRTELREQLKLFKQCGKDFQPIQEEIDNLFLRQYTESKMKKVFKKNLNEGNIQEDEISEISQRILEKVKRM